jgi:hypothetical protein
MLPRPDPTAPAALGFGVRQKGGQMRAQHIVKHLLFGRATTVLDWCKRERDLHSRFICRFVSGRRTVQFRLYGIFCLHEIRWGNNEQV